MPKKSRCGVLHLSVRIKTVALWAALLWSLCPAWSLGQAEASQPRPSPSPSGIPELPAQSFAIPAENLVQENWAPWSRIAGALKVQAPSRAGTQPIQLYHSGPQDWAFTQSRTIHTAPGQVYLLHSLVCNLDAALGGELRMELTTRNAQGEVLAWGAASRKAKRGSTWQILESRLVVPKNCTEIQFRFSGTGPSAWALAQPALYLTDLPDPARLEAVTIQNKDLQLTVAPAKGTTILAHKNRQWIMDSSAMLASLQKLYQDTRNGLPCIVLDTLDSSGSPLQVSLELAGDRVKVQSSGQGPLDDSMTVPGSLESQAGDSWVLPINQGLLVPSDDPWFTTGDLIFFGGHGLCMPFFALEDGRQSLIVLVETPDDASMHFEAPVPSLPGSGTPGSTSRAALVWNSSKGDWAYVRTAWLVPLEGDYNQVAAAYRTWVADHGRLITLKEKAKTVPQVAKMAGAVNLWWWKNGPAWTQDDQKGVVAIASEFKAAGIDRVLWSHEQDGPTIGLLNKLGFLTGRYDIYQDVWGPDNPHPWVEREGWPDDLILDETGQRIPGWVDRDDSGKEYPGGVICSAPAVNRAKTRIARDLQTHPYGARFIDTTTASPLRECWNPLHPQTRSQDKEAKMAVLDMIGRDFGLVTGSETGFDAAVPYLHYFEGMMSLGPYRLPDSGYDLFTYKKPGEDFLRFQTGSSYRIPLFELVYHDCVFDSWYWGDASNRVPELWDERDMLNALYGTLPLWAMDPGIWQAHKDRFIQSYRNATQVAAQTAWSALEEHRFEDTSHQHQSTRFADGTRVYANFAPQAWVCPTGEAIPARSFLALLGGKTRLASWESTKQ